MLELIRIIHFLSFSIAIGAGVANIMAGRRLVPLPAEAMPKLGAYRMAIGKLSTVCLALLWITGIGLIFAAGTSVFANGWFLLKLAAVLLLTAISVLANLTVIKARKAGTPPDPARMKLLGHAGPAVAVLIVILAVMAFG